MLKPRIIVSLLVHKGGLYKTTRFGEPKYVGDPINAVKIFNEKEVDELAVADIDAGVTSAEPNYNLISKLAAECRMPLCYSGGVKTLEHVERIISIGVEKVALGSAAVLDPDLVSEAAARVGSQSIAAVLDVKKNRAGSYEVVICNGRKMTGVSPAAHARSMQERGAGEIIVNSVDRDGTMSGFDLNLISVVRDSSSLPMTVLGGAGSLADVQMVIKRFGVLGVAAGSFFVFRGRFRAVLINYPTRIEKESLWLDI
jgi:cyclase